jgi:hypothetical protein
MVEHGRWALAFWRAPHKDEMERYVFAVMREEEVMLIGKGSEKEMASGLVGLLERAVSLKTVGRVARSLGVKVDGE